MQVLLTLSEVAELLKLRYSTVKRMCSKGVIPGFKRSPRRWGVMQHDLEKWINAQRDANSEAAKAK